jgi:propanol-preferring alcohol dehydrogenase
VHRADRLPHSAYGRGCAVIGIYGFGAAAHIVAKSRHQGRKLFAFTRPGDLAAQVYAGCGWAGSSDHLPRPLDAADLCPGRRSGAGALAATKKGGTVVCGGIHMSDIPSFPYRILWKNAWFARL